MHAIIYDSIGQNFMVPSNPTEEQIFWNKNCASSHLLKRDNVKKKNSVLPPKTVIKGVFSQSYCCNGNLCHENVFRINLAVFLYHDYSIKWLRVTMTN